MTVTESIAVNLVVQWVIGGNDHNGQPVPDQKAKEALQILAKNANKQLMAGVTPENIDKTWKQRRFKS